MIFLAYITSGVLKDLGKILSIQSICFQSFKTPRRSKISWEYNPHPQKKKSNWPFDNIAIIDLIWFDLKVHIYTKIYERRALLYRFYYSSLLGDLLFGQKFLQILMRYKLTAPSHAPAHGPLPSPPSLQGCLFFEKYNPPLLFKIFYNIVVLSRWALLFVQCKKNIEKFGDDIQFNPNHWIHRKSLWNVVF